MQLKSLEITLEQWGENKGNYTAKIEFVGDSGGVKLVLDPKVSAALLAHCGAVIQEFSNRAAVDLRTAIEASVLEAQRGPALLVDARRASGDGQPVP